MSDPMKQAWNDVADSFSMLGRTMKERCRATDDDGSGDTATAASAKADEAALREALAKLVAAGREFGDRAVDVARDDEVKAQAKLVASSLNDAVSATVDLIGEHVDGLFDRFKGNDETPEVPAPDTLPTKSASDD